MNADENVERERERARSMRAPSSCNSSPTVMMLPEFRDRVYSRRATTEYKEYVGADGGKVGR